MPPPNFITHLLNNVKLIFTVRLDDPQHAAVADMEKGQLQSEDVNEIHLNRKHYDYTLFKNIHVHQVRINVNNIKIRNK